MVVINGGSNCGESNSDVRMSHEKYIRHSWSYIYIMLSRLIFYLRSEEEVKIFDVKLLKASRDCQETEY